ncbi:fibronectin type III domain-containing protein [Haloferula helveola]
MLRPLSSIVFACCLAFLNGQSVASDFVELDNRVFVRHSTGIAEFVGTGSGFDRTIRSPAAERFATDGIQIFRLNGDTVTSSTVGGSATPLWIDPAGASDIFLFGRELFVIRNGSPILRLDRFSGANLGTIDGIADGSAYIWKRSERSNRLIGIRSTGSGIELISLQAGDSPQILSLATTSFQRGVSGSLWLQPDPGGTRAWLPDGSLRLLDDGSVVADLGSTIAAAAHLTAGSSIVAQGLRLRHYDHDGTLLATYNTTRSSSHVSFQRNAVLAIGGNAQGQRRAINEAPFATRPVILPPHVGRPESLLGYQMLKDGRVLIGNASREWAHLFDLDSGLFGDPFPIPRAGNVDAQPGLARVAWSSHVTASNPVFADFTAFPAWEGSPLGGGPSSSTDQRLVTDRDLILRRRESGSTTNVAFNFATGSQGGTVPSELMGASPAVWDETSSSVVYNDSESRVRRYQYLGNNLVAVATDEPENGAAVTSSFSAASDGGHFLAMDDCIQITEVFRERFDLETEVLDATWIGSLLFTIRPGLPGTAFIERRELGHLMPSTRIELPLEPIAIRNHQGEVVAIGRDTTGNLHFTRLLEDLTPVEESPRPAATPTGIAVDALTDKVVRLRWTPPSTAFSEALLTEWRALGSSAWQTGGIAPPEATTSTVLGLSAGTSYEVRVRSICEYHESVSDPVTFTTLGSSSDYTSEALYPRIRLDESGAVVIRWDDLFNAESGYRLDIERTDGGSSEQVLLPENSEEFVHTAADPAFSYDYTLRVLRIGAPVAASPPVRFSPGGLADTGRQIRTKVGAGSLGLHQLSIINPPEPDWDYLFIERSDDDGVTWQRLRELDAGARAFVDYSAPAGIRVLYRVNLGTPAGEIIGQTNYAHGTRFDSKEASDWYARHDDVIYLLRHDTGEVDRYDLILESWLPPIQTGLYHLTRRIDVSDAGIFVATNKNVFRLTPGGPKPFEGIASNTRDYITATPFFWAQGDWIHVVVPPELVSRKIPTGETSLQWLTMACATPDVETGLLYAFSGDDISSYREEPEGTFTTVQVERTPIQNLGAEIRHWRNAGMLLSGEGPVFGQTNFELPIGGLAPWFDGGLVVDERFLVRDESQIRIIDTQLDVVASTPVSPREHVVSASKGKVHVVGRSLERDPFWTVREVSASAIDCFPFRPSGFPVAVGTPRLGHFEPDGTFWAVHAEQGLIARHSSPDSVPEVIDLGGVVLDALVTPDGAYLCTLLAGPGIERRIRIDPIGDGLEPAFEFPVAPGGEGLAVEPGRLIVITPSGTQAYGFDGVSLGPTVQPGLRTGTFDPETGIPIQLGFGGNDSSGWTLSIGSNFVEELGRHSPLTRPLVIPDPESPWIFSWPGGARSVDAPSSAAHISCINPVAGCWLDETLVLIDRISSRESWLLCFDPSTGAELRRRRIPEKSHAVSSLPDGTLQLAQREIPGYHSPLGFDAALGLIDLGLQRPPGPRWREEHLVAVEGGSLEIYPLVVGDGPESFAWKHDGLVLPDQTGPVLRLSDLSVFDNGKYSLTVTSGGTSRSGGDYRVEVRPTSDISSRVGNLLTVSEDQLVEFDSSGVLAQHSTLPVTLESEASVTMDALGRIHLSHTDPILLRPIVDSFDPQTDSWTRRILPQSTRDHSLTGSHAAGEQLRCQDLRWNLANGLLTRTDSSVIRSFGPDVATDRRLETFDGIPITVYPVEPNLLSNGWWAKSLYLSSTGRSGGVFTDIRTGRVSFKESPHESRNPGLPTGPNQILFPSVEGVLEFDTTTNIWTELPFPTAHRLHRIGGDYTSTLPDHSYSQATAYYLGRSVFNLQDKYDRSWFQLQNLSYPVFVLPDEAHPDGGTFWDHGTSPYSLPGDNPPLTPYREGNILRFQFIAPADSNGNPASDFQFSSDLSSWATRLPPNVSVSYEWPYWQIRMRTDSPGIPQTFFRISHPESPFD